MAGEVIGVVSVFDDGKQPEGPCTAGVSRAAANAFGQAEPGQTDPEAKTGRPGSRLLRDR